MRGYTPCNPNRPGRVGNSMDYPEFTRDWPSFRAEREREHPDSSQLRPAEPGPAPAASDLSLIHIS
eukprot:3840925-Alexandrium_andersonii.AAC.1